MARSHLGHRARTVGVVTDTGPQNDHLFAIEAEAALVGTMLMLPSCIGDVMELVVTADFAKPAHALIFDALVELHTAGEKISAVAVKEVLASRRELEAAGGSQALLALNSAADGAWRPAARVVTRTAALRRVHDVLGRGLSAVRSEGADPADVAEALVGQLSSIDLPIGHLPDGYGSLEEFFERPQQERMPWVVPGVMRAGWRALIVGGEGDGKTSFSRQFGFLASQGIHPLAFEPIRPARTLLVDLENPDDHYEDMMRPLYDRVRLHAGDRFDSSRFRHWRREDGIDLRQRRDRQAFEAVLMDHRPDIVCLGPLYKAFYTKPSENYELAAGEVQKVLDALRVRFGFALLIEHHAPGEGGNASRPRLPKGSVMWRHWPEFGFFLSPVEGKPLRRELFRFRRDRFRPNGWPRFADQAPNWPKGPEWLWTGHWPEGRQTAGDTTGRPGEAAA